MSLFALTKWLKDDFSGFAKQKLIEVKDKSGRFKNEENLPAQ